MAALWGIFLGLLNFDARTSVGLSKLLAHQLTHHLTELEPETLALIHTLRDEAEKHIPDIAETRRAAMAREAGLTR